MFRQRRSASIPNPRNCSALKPRWRGSRPPRDLGRARSAVLEGDPRSRAPPCADRQPARLPQGAGIAAPPARTAPRPMITFRCTQKVRDLLGLRDRDLTAETDGDLQEWFVETATIERYRCLLFTHKLSLYSFWALAVRKPISSPSKSCFVITRSRCWRVTGSPASRSPACSPRWATGSRRRTADR